MVKKWFSTAEISDKLTQHNSLWVEYASYNQKRWLSAVAAAALAEKLENALAGLGKRCEIDLEEDTDILDAREVVEELMRGARLMLKQIRRINARGE